MGNQPSNCPPFNFNAKLTKEQVDEQCKPSGLYNSCPWSEDALRRLIKSGQVAQISIGSEFPSCEEEIHCPICFLYHPVSNRTKCCSASICTECYLQARPQKLPKHKDTGKQIPPTCPFCKNSSKKFKVTPYSNMSERDSSALHQNSTHSISENDELRTERRSWFQKNRPPPFEQNQILFDAKILLPVSQRSTATTTTTSTSSFLSCEQICDNNDCRSAVSSNKSHCDLHQLENEIKLLNVEQPRYPESHSSSEDGTNQRDLLHHLDRSTCSYDNRISDQHNSFLVNSNNNEDSRILEAAILLSIKEQQYMEQEARRLQQEEEDILAESAIAISQREDEHTVIPLSEDEQLRIAIEASLNDPKRSAYAVSPHSVTHTSALDYLDFPSMERLPHRYGEQSYCHRSEQKHELPIHQMCNNHQPENSSVQRWNTEYPKEHDPVSAYDACRQSSSHSPYPQNTTYNSNMREVGGREHFVHRNTDIDRVQQSPRRFQRYNHNDSANFDSEHSHRHNSSITEQYCAPNKHLTSQTPSQIGISNPDWQPQRLPYQRPLQSHLQSGSNDVARCGQRFQ